MLRIRFCWGGWFWYWLFSCLRCLFRSLLLGSWWLLRSLLSKLIRFKSWDIVDFFDEDSDRFSYSKCALIVDNFCNVSFISGFEGNSCLVSLNLADCVSNINFISFFNTPLYNFSFSHCWWQCWHLNNINKLHEGLDVWVIMRKRMHCY